MSSFSLISLNCFGVPTPTTRLRLLALMRELDRSDVDVVCLQEVQTQRYRHLLSQASTDYCFNAFEPFFPCAKRGATDSRAHAT